MMHETTNLKLETVIYLRRLMEKKKETLPAGRQVVMSGIRPTGFLHLGNYFGAMRNWVRMQEEFDCYYSVVDWHSLTTHPDTKDLKLNLQRVFAECIAAGMDPDKCTFHAQSDVPEIAELY